MNRVICSLFLLLLSILSVNTVTFAQVQIVDAFPNLTFDAPIDFQYADDGSNNIYVVERAGVIKKFDNDITTNITTTFLDISSLKNVSTNGEGGLLGLTFHPNFSSNGYFYVHYTTDNTTRSIIARYNLDAQNPDVADPSSELILLDIAQPYTNHNAGQLAFGSDGYLYIALGDGGSGGDPDENGQDRTTLLGSILRIDVDNQDTGLNYAIPSDNPYVGNSNGWREEIYAYGFRNPYRFSFDNTTNSLLVADVGENSREEVDKVESGKNYGWDVMEGSICHEPSSGCDTSGKELPVYEYDHSIGESITGGFVYRGERLPNLQGRYIYGDFVSGDIWSFDWDGITASDNQSIGAIGGFNLVAFGLDQAGEIYICSFDGNVYTLMDDSDGDMLSVPGTEGKDGWRFMGSPRIDESYANLYTGIWTQGAFGASTSSGSPNVYTWSEINQQFESVNDLNQTITNSSGHIIYMYEDDDPTAGGIQGGWPKLLTSSGTAKTGTADFDISYTSGADPNLNGFNLVANPYPNSIDWEAASGWTKTNMEDAIYIWDPNANSGNGAYKERVGGVGDDINVIAPFQAFFVQASGSGADLIATENVQTTGGVFLEAPVDVQSPISYLKLNLQTKGFEDQIYIVFREASVSGKDPGDALQLSSLAQRKLELYSKTPDGVAMAINSISSEQSTIAELPVYIETTESGHYELSWQIKDLPIGWELTLKDMHSGQLIALGHTESYRFKADSPIAAYQYQDPLMTVESSHTEKSPRFLLRINPGVAEPISSVPSRIELNQNYPNPFNPTTVIRFGLPEASKVSLEIYNILGQQVSTLVNDELSAGFYEVNFDASRLSSGTYLYKLTTGNTVTTKKMLLIK